MNSSKYINKIWIIPAIVVFFIALIPTIKYQWPLSWDIIYHIQYAKVYSQHGLTFINPLMNAPTGERIAYPPLFHFIIAFIGDTFRLDYFSVARILQPILAFSIVLSISYVAKEFYGKIAGISAGFLMISSYLVFRIMLPLPENIALIFIPIVIYLYYLSIKKNVLKYALLSGILFLFIVLSHQAAVLCTILVIIAFTILELLFFRNTGVFKNLGAFLTFSFIIISLISILIAIFKPDILFSIFNQGISAVTGYSTSLSYTQTLSTYKYIQYFGPIVLISLFVGIIFAFKKRSKKNYFVLTWIFVLFLLSNAYWFGINVLTSRVLIYILVPLSIFGGYGVRELYYYLKKYDKDSIIKLRYLFLIVLLLISTLSGIITVSSPVFNFQAQTNLGNIQIAPPSASEIDLANWFNQNGDKNRSIIISNLYTGNVIAAVSEVPIHYGFEYFNNNTPLTTFKTEKIGYIVFDKRLIFKSANGTIYVQPASSEFYPLFFVSGNIDNNLNKLVPPFTKKVYENDDFIVIKVDY